MSTFVPSSKTLTRKWFVLDASGKTLGRLASGAALLARRPEAIVEQAIKGMLPKTKMGRQMATKLKVYKGDKHPHDAQQPQPLEVTA